MTEKLKTLMDRSADMEFAVPDLDAIVRDGDRTVRRRRLAVGAGGLALVAVTTAVVGLALPGDGPERVATDPEAAPVVPGTWTFDQTLHADGRTFDLGHTVSAYVRTSAGYAFVDEQDVVYSYVDGVVAEVEPLDSDYPQLFADDEGSLVGWVTGTGDGRRFVVHDLADGRTETFGQPEGMEQRSEFDPFTMYAIDGRTAYVRDSRGAIAVDVDTGEVRVIEADPKEWFDIKGVEDGAIAFQAGNVSSDSDAGTVVGTSPTDGVGLTPGWGGPAYFSPDGRYVSLEGDEPEVYDTSSGKEVTVDLDGRPFGTGFEWVDGDTLLVIASERLVGPLQVLSCEVPAGTCTVLEQDLGLFDDISGRIAFAQGLSTE